MSTEQQSIIREVKVVRIGRRGNCWSTVRVTLQSWRGWRLNYSPVLRRYAGGHMIDGARKDPDFLMYEFEITEAVHKAVVEEHGRSPLTRASIDLRKRMDVAKVLETWLKRHKGKPYTHSGLAQAIAPKLEIKYTRLRTHYLPAIAEVSPYWRGRYWECSADASATGVQEAHT